MERITEKVLQYLVDRINEATGNIAKPYTKVGDRFKANIGNYHLSGAYSGWQLQQMVNENGGIRSITSGYVPKRELYYQLSAYLSGLSAKVNARV